MPAVFLFYPPLFRVLYQGLHQPQIWFMLFCSALLANQESVPLIFSLVVHLSLVPGISFLDQKPVSHVVRNVRVAWGNGAGHSSRAQAQQSLGRNCTTFSGSCLMTRKRPVSVLMEKSTKVFPSSGSVYSSYHWKWPYCPLPIPRGLVK